MHAALIDVEVLVDQALAFTLHSFKRVLVTAGRLPHIPEPAIDVMAGWRVKSCSGAAAIHDSVSAISELVCKCFVRMNIQNGLALASTGSIPMAPKVSFSQISAAPPPHK